ncbi:MAG: hypothetical protein OYH77_05875 [Pseudomonadota bacterium]|nr:hypothetical protein [Pseudomonadota bacterium]
MSVNLQRVVGFELGVDSFKSSATIQIPSLQLHDGYFYCDGKALYLRSARNKCALMRGFLDARENSLTLMDIIQIIHGALDDAIMRSMSPRLRACIRINVQRMLADTRSLLRARYREHHYLEWLPYSKLEDVWFLYRFRDDYVLKNMFAEGHV